MNKLFPALAALALLPTALAHVEVVPDDACDPAESPHHYGLGASGRLYPPEVRVGDVVTAGDGCPQGDGDPESGVGGGFFPASHHGDTACVTDDAFGARVALAIGADGDGDGAITPAVEPADHLAYGVGCATAAGPPGADGGWWVLLQWSRERPYARGHIETS